MQPLSLIHLHCDIPGLIRLNGSYAGQTPGTLAHYAPPGRLLIEFIPLCDPPEAYFLSFARQVTLAGGDSAAPSDGTVELYLLPGDAYALHLHPPRLPAPQIPRALASHRFQAGNTIYTAELFWDGCCGVAWYDAAGTPLFSAPFCTTLPRHPKLFTRLISGQLYLFAQGEMAGDTRLLCAEVARKTLCLNELCRKVLCSDAALTLTQDIGCRGYAMRLRYTNPARPPAAHLEQIDTPVGCDLGMALLQAVRCGAVADAMALLSPALREQLSPEDLQEYLGEVGTPYPALCSDSAAAVAVPLSPGVFEVRCFAFSAQQGKITDLELQ